MSCFECSRCGKKLPEHHTENEWFCKKCYGKRKEKVKFT